MPTLLKATVFVSVLIIGLGAYVLVFGSVKEFSFKALSAEAKFVRGAAKTVREDAEEIERIKSSFLDTAKEINNVKAQMAASLEDALRLEHRLAVKSQNIRALERKVFDPDGVGKTRI